MPRTALHDKINLARQGLIQGWRRGARPLLPGLTWRGLRLSSADLPHVCSGMAGTEPAVFIRANGQARPKITWSTIEPGDAALGAWLEVN